MECRSRRLPRGVIPLFSLLVGNAGAAPAALDRYAGTFSGSGTIVEGPEATSHQVRCRFTIVPQGATGLALQGTCRAYLIVSRSISANLAWDPRSGQVTGTYTGSRVGTARLTGRQVGTDFDLPIEWPKPPLRRHDGPDAGCEPRPGSLPHCGHRPHRGEWSRPGHDGPDPPSALKGQQRQRTTSCRQAMQRSGSR
jgi:hypothetical protein